MVSGRFDLVYDGTSIRIFSVSPREGHLELENKVFWYIKKYTKQGYAINTQPLTINIEYEKVELSIDFGNQYSYFQEEIDDRYSESIFDELDLDIFIDPDHGNYKVTEWSITCILSVVGSTPTSWPSKRQTSVQICTLGVEFTAQKRRLRKQSC